MSNFETWWECEGKKFLYALNTTTDNDIKLVAEFAWKNGVYCAEKVRKNKQNIPPIQKSVKIFGYDISDKLKR